MLYQLVGVVGLLCIIAGVMYKKRRYQDEFYIAGGILLTVYSVAIGDIIFIILQVVFTCVAIFDLARLKR